MPELPEVETVRKTLKKQILHRKIKEIKILYKPIIENDIEEFKKNLIGKELIDIKRNGKWLIFDFGEYCLLSHLRMEGKYFLKTPEDPIEKHEHIIFTFSDNTDLRYHDTRKFGRMILTSKKDLDNVPSLTKLGIEPMKKELTKDYLYQKLHNKKLPIKTLLLDQTIINGLGNIYANEVLFDAGIFPLKEGSAITIKECDKICSSSNKIIKKAIEEGGTTIKSYTSSLGVTGRFQQHLMVHKKALEPCRKCGTIIENVKVGGRSTYFCPNCQK